MTLIDIGCGTNKHPQATYGIDRLALPGVDFVCNFEFDRLPFDDSSVDVVFSRHTLEHLDNLEHLLEEIIRVGRHGSSVHIVVPHFSNTLGYSDYTHKRFFGYYTFDYFSEQKDRKWRVPTYSDTIRFIIRSKRLKFQNLSILAPVAEWLFNRSSFLAYLYESKLAWLIPCFEIEFELVVEKDLES